MATNDYHFITHWNIPNTPVEEISEILGNGTEFAGGLLSTWVLKNSLPAIQ